MTTTLLTVLLTTVHLCSSNTIITISALEDPVILPDGMLRPSQILICVLTPSSLASRDYESRWITPSGAMITRSTSIGRYVVTEGTVPVSIDRVLVRYPATLIGIQSLSYIDAASYTCEARSTNSTDETDWVSASVHLQLNMELMPAVTEIQASVNDYSIEMSCEMSQFIRPDSFLVWEGPSGQRIDSDTEKYQITFRNGTPAAAANGSPILVPSRLSTLNISNPMPSDSGSYTCTVMGTNQSATIDVNVEGQDTDDTMATTTQATDQRDTSTIILIATLVPILLALLVMAVLVAICVCKKTLKKKQNQLEQEVYYSVVDPPALSERNAVMSCKQDTHPNESTVETQTKNPAYGINRAMMSDQGIRTSAAAALDQRDLSPECCDAILLSPNTAYGTNMPITPEINDEEECYEEI